MNKTIDLNDVRRDYESTRMHKADLDADPFVAFGLWLQAARDLNLLDSTAMTLATADAEGQPSARIVLLKSFDEQGFCWFTDLRSQKGQEMSANPQAALLFHWRDLSRQIRVQGSVERLSAEVAEQYFNSRPEGSRFSAASSHQSAVVDNRHTLEDEVQRLRGLHSDGLVPRPESWIGYRLKPLNFEFWQGQMDRLHDRIVYKPEGEAWVKSRISP